MTRIPESQVRGNACSGSVCQETKCRVRATQIYDEPTGIFSTSSDNRRQLLACNSAYFTRSWDQSWCNLLTEYWLCWKKRTSSRMHSRIKTPRACCWTMLSLSFIMLFSTFSISPGLIVPSGLLRRVWSLFSDASIRRSSCGILSLAYRSRRSNISRIPTKQSRCFLKSSRAPASHALASSSSRDWADDMCLAVALIPSFSKGTSFVSIVYVSAVVSVRLCSAKLNFRLSAARPSLRFARRSVKLQRLTYISADLFTPARQVSKVSFKLGGRLSSKFAGSVLPTNSSCTDTVACLRQTDSSYQTFNQHNLDMRQYNLLFVHSGT